MLELSGLEAQPLSHSAGVSDYSLKCIHITVTTHTHPKTFSAEPIALDGLQCTSY